MLPTSGDPDNPYIISYVHLALEQGSSVLVQIQADDGIVLEMQGDSTYTWVGDIVAPAQQLGGKLLMTSIQSSMSSPDVEAILEQFGITMDIYTASGLDNSMSEGD